MVHKKHKCNALPCTEVFLDAPQTSQPIVLLAPRIKSHPSHDQFVFEGEGKTIVA
jgi:hypothetical protein